jgi:hypothetical protein
MPKANDDITERYDLFEEGKSDCGDGGCTKDDVASGIASLD